MLKLDELPISIQTAYVDLIHRAWTGNLSDLTARGGSPYSREVRGRKYWYWQPPTEMGGQRPSALYLGPENEQTLARLKEMQDHVQNLRQRRDMVRALRAARLPVPDTITGNIMAAMADAGVFRLRAVVVGSVAFQTYPGLLGFHLRASLGRTSDLDIGQFRTISVAVDDKIDGDLESVLKTVDPRFQAVPYAMDGRKTIRYALRVEGDERFSVDVLSPMRGPEQPKINTLPALRSDAQFLRYLDFLLYQEVDNVALHGAGIPIKVPDPARFALHKLMVAQMRRQDNAQSAAKGKKDIEQAGALIRVLQIIRPDDLRDLWVELCERGENWKAMALKSLERLPTEVGLALGDDIPALLKR